ncbi:hypothetical protein DL93DRAFT_1666303 [Clavulina sp. PMI_390]|nr:hypothetical protein DL93DRAFT_1666303 [Clavulina sp. PMI_390]
MRQRRGHSTIIDPAAPRVYLHVPDGDVVLLSSDGIEFRVDSTILRRASPFFDAMFRLPSPSPPPLHVSTSPTACSSGDMSPDAHLTHVKSDSVSQQSANAFSSSSGDDKITNQHETIKIAETSSVLDDILRSLYPSSSRPLPIRSDGDAVGILLALEKYQISSWALAEAAEEHIGLHTQPSIRAWALALQADSEEARRLAVRRFIADGSTGLEVGSDGEGEDDLEASPLMEMRGVDAWRFVHLLRLKKQAAREAQALLEDLINNSYCSGHRAIEAIAKAKERAFENALLIEEPLGIISGYCWSCQSTYQNVSYRTQREMARARLEELMERVVLAERNGVPLQRVVIGGPPQNTEQPHVLVHHNQGMQLS